MSNSTTECVSAVPETDHHSAALGPRLVLDAAALDHVLTDARSDWVNAQAPHLPPLVWKSSSTWSLCGRVEDFAVDDPQALAEQWAAELGLAENPAPVKGTRSWHGNALIFVDDRLRYPVEIWYVSDRDAFEEK